MTDQLTPKQQSDAAYRERAHLVAWLAASYPSVIVPAPDVDEPGWQIVYLTVRGWQLSWHISPRDAVLFEHVEHVMADDPRAQWDGHTTEQKYTRIGFLAVSCGPECAEGHTYTGRCEAAVAIPDDTDATEAVCGAEPPRPPWGDCWCTLTPDHDDEHRCQPCTDRHGAPGWLDAEPTDTDLSEAPPGAAVADPASCSPEAQETVPNNPGNPSADELTRSLAANHARAGYTIGVWFPPSAPWPVVDRFLKDVSVRAFDIDREAWDPFVVGLMGDQIDLEAPDDEADDAAMAAEYERQVMAPLSEATIAALAKAFREGRVPRRKVRVSHDHQACDQCDITDPCPCCGLRWVDGRWVNADGTPYTSGPRPLPPYPVGTPAYPGLRHQYAQVISCAVADGQVPVIDCGTGKLTRIVAWLPTDHILDALMAVRDGEMQQLRAELEGLRRRAENAEAKVHRVRDAINDAISPLACRILGIVDMPWDDEGFALEETVIERDRYRAAWLSARRRAAEAETEMTENVCI